MAKICLRGLDDATISRIRADARRRKVSVNQRIIEVLRVHFSPDASTFDDLDGLVGTWSIAEAAAFECAIAPFSHVEPEGTSNRNGKRKAAL